MRVNGKQKAGKKMKMKMTKCSTCQDSASANIKRDQEAEERKQLNGKKIK